MAVRILAQVRRHKRGVALIITLAVLTLLALLGITFSMLSGIERGISRNYVDYVRAKVLAQNGVEDAMFKLRYCFMDSASNALASQFNAMFATTDVYSNVGGPLNINGTFTPSWVYRANNGVENVDNHGVQATSSGWTADQWTSNNWIPNFTTPLENALIPSFVYVNNNGWPYPIKINGVLTYFSGFMDTCAYGNYSDIYSLKVLDCSGMLYINDGLLAGPTSPTTLNMKRMLNVLGGLPSISVNLSSNTRTQGLGNLIIDNRPKYTGWRDKYQLVASGILTKSDFNAVKNFITTYSWVDTNVVNPVPLSSTVLSQYPLANPTAGDTNTNNIGRAYCRGQANSGIQFKVNAGVGVGALQTSTVYRYGDSPAGRSYSLTSLASSYTFPPVPQLIANFSNPPTAPPLQWYPYPNPVSPSDPNATNVVTGSTNYRDCGNIVWGYDELNPVWIENVARAPVNINTAPYEILVTMLADLQGFFMVERRRDAPLKMMPGNNTSPYAGGYTWLSQQFYYGSVYGPYTDKPWTTPSGGSGYNPQTVSIGKLDKNGIDALGYLYKTIPIKIPTNTTGTYSFISATQIAAEMIYCRSMQTSPYSGINYNPITGGVWWGGPFKTWRQFNRFVDALVWKPAEPNPTYPHLSDGTGVGSPVGVLLYDNGTWPVNTNSLNSTLPNSMYVDYAFNDTTLDEEEVVSPIQMQYASQAIADTLKANFNPNCHLNELNPDANIFTMVDKTDLICNSTEFTFTPMGYFEIECLARVLQPTSSNKSLSDGSTYTTAAPGNIYAAASNVYDNIIRAQKRISAVVKLFDVYKESTQSQFYGNSLTAKSYYSFSDMPVRRSASTAPLMSTNSNKALELGPEPAQGNLGEPAKDSSGNLFNTPSNKDLGDPNKASYTSGGTTFDGYLPNGVEYDGYLTLSTYGADYDVSRGDDSSPGALGKGTYISSLQLQNMAPTLPFVSSGNPWTFGDEELSAVIHSHFQLDTHSHYNATVNSELKPYSSDLYSVFGPKYRKDMACGATIYSPGNIFSPGSFGWGYPVPTYGFGWPVNAARGYRYPNYITPSALPDKPYDNTPYTSVDNPNAVETYSCEYSYWYGSMDVYANGAINQGVLINGVPSNGSSCFPKAELSSNAPSPTEFNLYPFQTAPYSPYEFGYDPGYGPGTGNPGYGPGNGAVYNLSGGSQINTDLTGRYRLAHSFRLPAYTSTTTTMPIYEIVAPSNLRKDGVYAERNSGVAYWIDEGISWDSMHGAISMWVKPGFFPEMSGKPRVWFSASRWHWQGSDYGDYTASCGYDPTAFGLFFLPAHTSKDGATSGITEAAESSTGNAQETALQQYAHYDYITGQRLLPNGNLPPLSTGYVNGPKEPPNSSIPNAPLTDPTLTEVIRAGPGRFRPCSLGFGLGFHDSAGYNADFDDPYNPNFNNNPYGSINFSSTNLGSQNYANLVSSPSTNDSLVAQLNGYYQGAYKVYSNSWNQWAGPPQQAGPAPDSSTFQLNSSNDIPSLNGGAPAGTYFNGLNSLLNSNGDVSKSLNGPIYNASGLYNNGNGITLGNPNSSPPNLFDLLYNQNKGLSRIGGNTNGLLGGLEGAYLSPTLNHIGHSDRYPAFPVGTYYLSDHNFPATTSNTQALSPIERPSYLKAHQWTNIIAKWTIPKQIYNRGTIPGRWLFDVWVNGQDFRVSPTGGNDTKALTGDNSIVTYNAGISYPYRRPHFSVQSFQMPENGKTYQRFNPVQPPPASPPGTFAQTKVYLMSLSPQQPLPGKTHTETVVESVYKGTATVNQFKTTYEQVSEGVTYPVIEWVASPQPVQEQVLDHYETETYTIQVLTGYQTQPNPTPQGTVPGPPVQVQQGTITDHSKDFTDHSLDTNVPNMVYKQTGTTTQTQQQIIRYDTVYVWDPVLEMEVPQSVPVYGSVTVNVPVFGWVPDGTFSKDHSKDFTNHSLDTQVPNYVWQPGPPIPDPSWQPTIQVPQYTNQTVTVQVPKYKTITVPNTVWTPQITYETATVPSYQLKTTQYSVQVPQYTNEAVPRTWTDPPIPQPPIPGTNPVTPGNQGWVAQVWSVQQYASSILLPPPVISNCIRLGETSYNGFNNFARNYSADATIDEFYLWKEGEAANAACAPIGGSGTRDGVNPIDPTYSYTASTNKDLDVDYANFPNNAGGSGSPNINNAFKLWNKGRYFRPDFTGPGYNTITAPGGRNYGNLSGTDLDVVPPLKAYIWNNGSVSSSSRGYELIGNTRPGYESQFKSAPTKITIVDKNGNLIGGAVKGGVTRYLPVTSLPRPPGSSGNLNIIPYQTGATTGSFNIFGLSWTWYGEDVMDKDMWHGVGTDLAPAGTPFLRDYRYCMPSDVVVGSNGFPYVILPRVVVSLSIYSSDALGIVEYGDNADPKFGTMPNAIAYYGWHGAEGNALGAGGYNYKDYGAFASTMIQNPNYLKTVGTGVYPLTPIVVDTSSNIKYRVQFLLSDSNGNSPGTNSYGYDKDNSILLTTPVFDDITFYLDTGQQIMSYTVVE